MVDLTSIHGPLNNRFRGSAALDGSRLLRARDRLSVLQSTGLPPTATATMTGGLPPQPTIGPMATGGGLPPTALSTGNPGGLLPPQTPIGPVRQADPLPPTATPTMRTGGGYPPAALPTVRTGGGFPPQPLNPTPALDGSQFVAGTTGGGPGTPATDTVGAIADQFRYSGANSANTANQFADQFRYSGGNSADAVREYAGQFAYSPGESPSTVAARIAAQFNTTPDQLPAEIVQGINSAFEFQDRPSASATGMQAMDDLLSVEGSYIRNARLRGLEQANSRGLTNSSMAAGASQRAALDAAQPIFSEIMGLNSQREAQDFNATMASRQQAFGLTSDREQQQFQRDMAGMEMAGQFAGMDRQAVINQAQQQFSAAMQLEGQEREAALAQARDTYNAAMQLEGQSRDAALTQSRDAFNAASGLQSQREQLAFSGLQNQLDRTQGVNNALLGSQLAERQAILDANLRGQLQSDEVAQQDWLSDRQFTREFNAALSTMTLGNAFDLNNAIMSYAAENPEIYTPEIISGMTNFFQMNMTGLLQQYFPDLMGGGS